MIRPRRRTACVLYAARCVQTQDLGGGITAGYDAARRPLRGTMIPRSNYDVPRIPGIFRQMEADFLLPPDADIRERDGLYASLADPLPAWRVAGIDRYPMHLRARLEEAGGNA